MENELKNEVLSAIRDAGFVAYMRKPEDTWCHYTDGTRIAYAQWGRDTMASYGSSVHLSTVHKPNRNSGTGFRVDITSLDAKSLESAFKYAPSWASPSQYRSVVKYRNWAEFQNASEWNKEYKQVD